MKTLATLTRHALTYLAGLLAAWLTLHLTGTDLESAKQAAQALIEPLVVLAGFVAVVVVRLAMPAFKNIFPDGMDKESGGSSGASGGKLPLGLLLCGTLAGIMGCLPACSNGVPLRINLTGPDGTASYSNTGGLAVDLRSGK